MPISTLSFNTIRSFRSHEIKSVTGLLSVAYEHVIISSKRSVRLPLKKFHIAYN